MAYSIFGRLWRDEVGAVIATEYLMLGTVVAVGGASGLAALRDGVSDEVREFGRDVGETRQAYMPPLPQASQPPRAGGAGGANGFDVRTAGTAHAAAPGAHHPLPPGFTCP